MRRNLAFGFAFIALACIYLFVFGRNSIKPGSSGSFVASNGADIAPKFDADRSAVANREVGKEHRDSPDVDLRDLSHEQLGKVEVAQIAYRDALKEIEFRNSKLKWSKSLSGRVIRVYDVNPASEDQIKEAKKAVDSILAGSDLKKVERKAFVKIASNALQEFLDSNKHGGVLFFDIPIDEDKNIVVIQCRERSGLDSLIDDLESSDGASASFGDNVTRSLSRTDAGWRYEKFLMIGE